MTEPLTLVFEMAVTRGVVGIWKDGIELGRSKVSATQSASDMVLPFAEDLLNRHGFRSSDIEGVVCSSGPGGYTGIRVGLAAAKGLARAVKAKVYGYPVYDVLLSAGDSGIETASIIEAGRGEFLVTRAIDVGATKHSFVKRPDLSAFLEGHRIELGVFVSEDATAFEQARSSFSGELIDTSDNITSLLYGFHVTSGGEGSSLKAIYGRDLVEESNVG